MTEVTKKRGRPKLSEREKKKRASSKKLKPTVADKKAADRAEARSRGDKSQDDHYDPLDPPQAKHPGGRPPKYKDEYPSIARKMCSMGASDADLADAFNVAVPTIWSWATKYPEFSNALKIEKGEYDDRVKRSLAQRALGYSYDAVKIFNNNGEPVIVPYREHVPPDPGAAKLWLSNRQPDEWRDKKEIEINPHENWLDLISRMGNSGE